MKKMFEILLIALLASILLVKAVNAETIKINGTDFTYSDESVGEITTAKLYAVAVNGREIDLSQYSEARLIEEFKRGKRFGWFRRSLLLTPRRAFRLSNAGIMFNSTKDNFEIVSDTVLKRFVKYRLLCDEMQRCEYVPVYRYYDFSDIASKNDIKLKINKITNNTFFIEFSGITDLYKLLNLDLDPTIYDDTQQEFERGFYANISEENYQTDVTSDSVTLSSHVDSPYNESGIIVWYKFDGDLRDSSGNGNDAYYGNGYANFTWGRFGLSYVSNNFTYYAKVDSVNNGVLTDELTIEFWYYPSTSGNSVNYIIQQTWNHIRCDYNWYRRFICYVRNNSGNYTSIDTGNMLSFTINEWHHIVFVYNKGNLSIWVDGTRMNNKTFDLGDLTDFTSLVYLAKLEPAARLDSLKVYNRALSEEEIKYNYFHYQPEGRYLSAVFYNGTTTNDLNLIIWHNISWVANETNGNVSLRYRVTNETLEVYNTSGLLVWWKLDTGDTAYSSVVTDYSGNGNDGIIGNPYNNPSYDAPCISYDSNGYFDGAFYINRTCVDSQGAVSYPYLDYIGTNLSQYSVELWFYDDGYTTTQLLMSLGGCGIVKRVDFLNMKWIFNGTYYQIEGIYKTFRWHYYAITFDNGVVRFYHDGKLIKIYTMDINTSKGDCRIELGNPWQPWHGYYDSFRFYNRVLTSEEIRWNYYHANFSNSTWSSWDDTGFIDLNETWAYYLQYEAYLTTTNTSLTPALDSVTIDWIKASDPPELTNLKFKYDPLPYTKNETATVLYTDPNGDNGTVTFYWYVNDNLTLTEYYNVTNGTTVSSTLPNSYYYITDKVKVVVTSKDINLRSGATVESETVVIWREPYEQLAAIIIFSSVSIFFIVISFKLKKHQALRLLFFLAGFGAVIPELAYVIEIADITAPVTIYSAYIYIFYFITAYFVIMFIYKLFKSFKVKKEEENE